MTTEQLIVVQTKLVIAVPADRPDIADYAADAVNEILRDQQRKVVPTSCLLDYSHIEGVKVAVIDTADYEEDDHLRFSDAPEAVRVAFEAVKAAHPEVVQVLFGIDGRWQYLDAEFNAPAFDDRVDVSVLEDAANEVPYLPYAYAPRT